MYAKVIVDVPAKPTNRAFDYVVPEAMKDLISVGSRVGVPFGPRTVQGFVVELHEGTELDPVKLKPIAQTLDLTPPLTPELVKLARWISRTYMCHEIIALQAMIPGALKAKYERHVKIAEPDGERRMRGNVLNLLLPKQEEIVNYIRKQETIRLETLLEKFAEDTLLVKQLLEDGYLAEIHKVKDRMTAKKALTVIPPEDPDQLAAWETELPARAAKQKQVLAYLQEHPEPIKLTDLLTRLHITAAAVKGLVEKGWIRLEEVEVQRDPYASRTFRPTSPLPLTAEQQDVFERIKDAVLSRMQRVFLLNGVTGSGKTEVYLQSIQTCLDQGCEAIVLVPEISLTPQMVERFKGRFGNRVAVLHSRLSHGERYDEWRKIVRREVSVVIGARSAVFAPFTNIGLIIIDEEHESSYKQEESPKYHTRDVAIVRALEHGASVVLGSATPSLESMYRTSREAALSAKPERPVFELLSMPSRVEGRPLPRVHIVDMRDELKNGNRSMFSRALYKAIEDRLHKKEQTVLLLNRRGYATFVMCRTCGYVADCPHCDISLTYHQSSRAIRCHYCGYAERELTACPDCGSEHIRHFGTGTQRVEEELSKLFPGIRVIRMDVDTTTEKGSHEKWLTMFKNRQADLLLGTQMVAKGLDFPHVTLVGALAADSVLNLPDFRAAERTFQLLTQVAGRAGRHELPGEVYVQTYTPEHYSILSASKHDYQGFMRKEMLMRKLHNYPPFHRLVLITLSHDQVQLLIRSGEVLAARLKELASQVQTDGTELEVLGPVASPISRIKDRYRFQCMIKYRGEMDIAGLVQQAAAVLDDAVKQKKLMVSIDVDPQILM
ncbi:MULTISPECIES: primosomal protein N' [unclassified Paenibacillus]|uniref:primosomal protein N' n=1 Tax=unclassified Paenibacillus TaxID=185978 RepID=UPI001AE9027F|nr:MULTISPECIES: primosomal protein N' [unclassified Paenibacillus]MBP1156095.1 primosomal protein N' (replication factor Y) [Paenibacillus sp. PvP091]MBP1168519.1 primosomal protein N' (replication factor Y) [Paenibacillus sp. PvR098]MBP2439547.1 primosomal protein N' (replication factor Y) [Paenibacillus sp. PvP052]